MIMWFGDFLRFILLRRIYLAGFTIVVTFIIIGVLAPYIVTMPEDAWGVTYHPEKRFKPPSLEHPLGTDALGRDLLNRIILGTRFSLVIGVSVVVIALLIGIPIGLVAGYFGGKISAVVMRVADMFLAFPPLLLAIAFASVLGRGILNTIIALALSWWPWYTRLIYIQTTSVKSSAYVDSARIIGLSPIVIMFKHIFPNVITPVATQATLDIGSAILEASALSFLGVGVPPPTPEWGLLIGEGWQYISRAWWVSLFPGLAILIVVLGFNLLGDALKEYMDPRVRNLMIMKRCIHCE
ncbi:MAG: ABC transporter permease [Desulfurococcus sp.]|uniref:ABC transporter permease n=1 Tax=Desulfurococcus sp. TaxID=51678 RepID=UPI0031787290